ncbi:Nematode Specific Peptide family, group E [Caenorhabditis elegans]|uniref:Nematode Specific Peptide family, group E n=1 Tax=Caenorhabditis elegans TaxID=6239 RepID=Q7YWR1_CAEEL|nr:Nematode Specific Peptide family, group E [Caenorhabditis elegans]CAE17993.1 Nematode Specific Peptide family, group E [Caenorhabditis elegans]|eukprot:NP_001022425.1 Nematode Specific Peptide family, group E [Caenorhabditis elegans]
MSRIILFAFFSIYLLATVSAGIIRDRRAIEDYFNSNDVVNNVIQDNMLGGPTSLGWAQVPHVYSPMFSPVFGK